MRWCRFIHFFLLFGFIGFTEGFQDQKLCNSSCGSLQIRYPFRLEGDPTNCGNPSYELTCSGHRTFMKFLSTQFFIKDINYRDKIIKVIEIGLLRSNCSLPFKSLGRSFFLNSKKYNELDINPYLERSLNYHLVSWNWISLVNCSKNPTFSSYLYQLIPCLSHKDSYVYGVPSYYVGDLEPSCSFLSMIPANEISFDPFQDIHNGFSLSWSTNGFGTSFIIRQCFRESWSIFQDNFKRSNFLSFVPAFFYGEMNFLACLNHKIFRLNTVVIVFMQIVIQSVQLMLVLLMEMAAGRRNVDADAGSSNQNYFPSLIYDKLKLDYSAEEGIKIESFEMNEVEKKLCLVGLWCIQIRPFDRPSMRQVLDMIEGDVEAIQFPPKPFFSCSSSISRTLHSDDTPTSKLTVIEEDDVK